MPRFFNADLVIAYRPMYLTADYLQPVGAPAGRPIIFTMLLQKGGESVEPIPPRWTFLMYLL